ncbi:M20/M25/M40 family metallo-hydrolase [Chitinophaga horti]|uniref:M20/M25/M40 family metallo-hydrolase n=1 Tax=Chitinophaga horti TaxID=2920382 RepID=A0ABY6J0U7_9BACT|nr:M20/M25/M40 family metallo-hydrolase [Chitinophaga horti]UYQ93282.1 M20/M25/M40 family metallo-hydrolase [Chitinophaga horti]
MIMKKALLLALPISLGIVAQTAQAQKIRAKEVKKIITTLAADDMGGRPTFKPGIDKASVFLENEFKKAGLQPLAGSKGYRQEFNMYTVKSASVRFLVNSREWRRDDVAVVSNQPRIEWRNTDKITVETITDAGVLRDKYRAAQDGSVESPTLVWVDASLASAFKGLKGRRARPLMSGEKDNPVVFVLKDGANEKVAEWSLSATQELNIMHLNNVAGIITGESKPDEYVVFSGHYDHIGILKPNEAKDSIANGADDDASGTTAVVMLANYYKKKKPARSIIFVAFTAEEIGGYGSQYFSRQLDPAKVVAMFNIEMIGKESKFGRNSAFITGFEKSDFGTILQKNLQGSAFKFHPDPYPEQNLFYRSDNATLARLGVPAHTISTTQIDKDKLYHSVDDEVESLDIQNITDIIKAIAKSAESIISGKDTPTRVTDVK